MNQWANTILTDKGTALLAKLTQGHSLHITEAVVGAGYVNPTLLAKQTAITSPKGTLNFRPVSYPNEGQCAITVSMSNEGITAGYTAMQVGLYAQDPDDGEILFLICQAANSNSGTIIPSAEEMPGYYSEWTFYLAYGQANGVEVAVNQAGTVSREEMEAYVGEAVQAKPGEIVGTHRGEIFNDYTNNKAELDYSHAEGNMTTAYGEASHAEGRNTTASGMVSHAEGSNTTASGNVSHAEGSGTKASGVVSHAEGCNTEASGEYSHAEGYYAKASGNNSHAEGSFTIAAGRNQHVQGKHNVEDTENKYAHIVGNGEPGARSNAHTIDWNGNAWFAGAVDVEDPDTTRANLGAAPAYTYGTSDLTAGESELETGVLYFVYE